MASIYRDKKSGYWYINYITPDGRRVRKSLGTKDRKLAELALKDFEVMDEEAEEFCLDFIAIREGLNEDVGF